MALHGQPYIQEAEGFIWAVAYLMVKALFIAGHNYVIVDATNYSEKRKLAWKKHFPGHAIRLHFFNTSEGECIERAKADGREDLIPVIERMAANEEPNAEQK